MAHDDSHIDTLDTKATLADVITKLNEVIERINHMWYPDDV